LILTLLIFHLFLTVICSHFIDFIDFIDTFCNKNIVVKLKKLTYILHGCVLCNFINLQNLAGIFDYKTGPHIK